MTGILEPSRIPAFHRRPPTSYQTHPRIVPGLPTTLGPWPISASHSTELDRSILWWEKHSYVNGFRS
ncbi:hypothetical protein BDR07DRAFT_1403459 [Suillus spraguei]|nr:hypothetical protein BDR07DRAFT_1403459 [Suillus spraguei]